MSRQIDQFEIFEIMIKAMEVGKSSDVKKMDGIIRRGLSENKKRDLCSRVLSVSSEEVLFLKKLHK